MSRRTFIKDEVKITYGNGRIQSHTGDDGIERNITTMNESMYFYYDINVLFGNKVVFEADAYDFPKVQYLAEYIDYMINFNMDKAYLMEDFEDKGFHRNTKYAQIKLEDMNVEYFYKIERYDTIVKQRHEDLPKSWSKYMLTIGVGERDKEGNSSRTNYGKCVYIDNLDKEDLMRLKNTTLAFCEESIRIHNLENSK